MVLIFNIIGLNKLIQKIMCWVINNFIYEMFNNLFEFVSYS